MKVASFLVFVASTSSVRTGYSFHVDIPIPLLPFRGIRLYLVLNTRCRAARLTPDTSLLYTRLSGQEFPSLPLVLALELTV